MFNHPSKTMNFPAIRKDTKAWKAQVWISFAAAATLCSTGLAYLPGRDVDRRREGMAMRSAHDSE